MGISDYRARLNRLEETIAPDRLMRVVVVKKGQAPHVVIDAAIARLRLTPVEAEASHWVCLLRPW